MTPARTRHSQAIAMLLLANLFWGLSFPLIKAVVFVQKQLVQAGSTWFITAMMVAPRFLLATALLLAFGGRRLAGLTAAERRQGLLLGLSAGCGMFLQNDGLQFTSASVSAFLTQFYAVMIPLVIAVRTRRSPPPVVWVCGALVLAGVGVLGHFDVRTMRLGRGEIETLAGSFFFMGQIFVLADRRCSANRVLPVTVIMFATEAVLFTVLAMGTAPHPGDFLVPWRSGPWLAFTMVLTVVCTVGSFTLMNRWQPMITPTEAGLIYCSEPVFASLMALVLPAWFSRLAGLDYANEIVTWRLLAGGGLVTLANILIQLKPPAPG
jgi:drug/metabolite transporter (DMT)-like permease